MAELRYVDWDGLFYYDGKIKQYIKDRDEDYIKMGGIVSFDNLPDPTYYNLHHVYKITNDFTTNSRFDTEGYNFKAGTWVLCVDLYNDASQYRYVILNAEESEIITQLSADIDKKLQEKADINELTKYATSQYVDITFATKTELEEAVNSIEHPTVDLEGYATEEWVNAQGFLTEHQDLSEYAKKSEVPTKVSQLENDVNYLTEHQSLEGYAKLTDIPDVSTFATKTEVADQLDNIKIPTKVSELDNDTKFVTEDNLSDYAKRDELFSKDYNDLINTPVIPSIEGLATEDFVKSEIAKAELNGGEVTEEELNNLLANYYNKSEVDARIPDVSELVTRAELDVVQNVAGSNSVKLMQLDSDLVDINNQLTNIPTTYAAKDEVAAVEAKVDAIVIPEVPTKLSELENDAGYITAKDIPETDLSNYYNKSETENLIAEAVKDIEHPTVDLEGYATEEWVNDQGFIKEVPNEYVTETELDNKGYLTEHQDLSEYAKKSDIPQPELFVVDYFAPNFAVAFEAYNSGKLLILTNAAPDANGYAVMNYVRDDMITFTKFLTSRSETYGSFNTYYLHSDNTWEVSSEVKLNKVEANVSDAANIDLTSIRIGKEVYRLPETDLSEYYTKTEVDTKFENVEYPDPDLSNYFTKDETTSAIDEAIEGIDIPQVDLEPYATKTEVAEQVASKADNVPFVTDMFVTNPQGSFTSGDNLKGLNIATILTKLLGLQETPAPDEPDIPDEPITIVDKIIQTQLGMYQVNEAAQLIEIPYNYVTYDNTSYDAAPDANYFYQKLDEKGEVVESGYQHASDENDSMYYLIALPQGVNFNENVSVKVWDETSNTWTDVTDTLEMSSDLQFIEESLAEAEISMPTIPEGYTLWIDSSLNTCTGSDYRFIINE